MAANKTRVKFFGDYNIGTYINDHIIEFEEGNDPHPLDLLFGEAQHDVYFFSRLNLEDRWPILLAFEKIKDKVYSDKLEKEIMEMRNLTIYHRESLVALFLSKFTEDVSTPIEVNDCLTDCLKKSGLLLHNMSTLVLRAKNQAEELKELADEQVQQNAGKDEVIEKLTREIEAKDLLLKNKETMIAIKTVENRDAKLQLDQKNLELDQNKVDIAQFEIRIENLQLEVQAQKRRYHEYENIVSERQLQ